jgi:hypothetical protein
MLTLCFSDWFDLRRFSTHREEQVPSPRHGERPSAGLASKYNSGGSIGSGRERVNWSRSCCFHMHYSVNRNDSAPSISGGSGSSIPIPGAVHVGVAGFVCSGSERQALLRKLSVAVDDLIGSGCPNVRIFIGYDIFLVRVSFPKVSFQFFCLFRRLSARPHFSIHLWLNTSNKLTKMYFSRKIL